MKPRTLLLLSLLLAGTAAAQRHKLDSINAETPEGKLITQIGAENDLAKKAALMEEFGKTYSQHPGVGWVYAQLQDVYTKNNQPEKAIEVGERLLAMDANDLDAAYGNLKAAEAKKDSDAVLKWSTLTADLAAKATGEEAEHGKDVAKYVDYARYSVASQEQDPAKAMKLIEAMSSKSEYLPQALSKYAVFARQGNAIPQAVAFGEKLYPDIANEDLLLLMADASMRAQKNDKTAEYGVKAAELASSRPKPEGVADADWEKRKNALVGMGNWMAGMGYAGQNKFAQADKVLRTALPLVKDQPQVYNMALFNLGLANYQLAKASKNKTQITDALKFTEQAAATPGPFQAQAQKNVPVIKKEFGLK